MSKPLPLPSGPAQVREETLPDFPAAVHGGWAEAFPWVVQGTTTRGDARQPFDLGLFGDASPASAVIAHWEALRAHARARSVVHAPQVHGALVRFHGAVPSGIHVSVACDGHATSTAGLLLAVTTADCVPLFLLDPVRRAIGVLHAGWRGIARRVLEKGIAAMEEHADSTAEDLHVHLGPAICGACYEVGPEVFGELGQEVPARPTPIDLRAILAERAEDAGVRAENLSISEHCTRCGDSAFFSHRRGDRARQVGFLGIRS